MNCYGGNCKGNIVAMMMAMVAMMGVAGVTGMNLLSGPISTASKVTHQNMAQNDLLMNAKVVVMNASTRPQFGDEDGDGYVEPAPFIPTSDASCAITLPAGGEGGCLPADIGAIQTDPWGTQYAYCVWDHGEVTGSANRIEGEDSTSGAVLAIISAGPNKRFETPCSAYDGDPATNDIAINPNGVGDDLVQIYTYAAAVAGSGGLWELKDGEPTTAVIDKKLEIGDVGAGTGFAFDTQTGTGEFPYVKADYIASKSGNGTPVEFMDNIALAGKWLSGDGDSEGIFVNSNGNVSIGTNLSTLDPTSKLMIGDRAITLHEGGASAIGFNAQYSATNNQWEKGSKPYWGAMVYHPEYGFFAFHSRDANGPASTSEALLTIRADGRVGIGTAVPTGKLHVVGDYVNPQRSSTLFRFGSETTDSGPPSADGLIVRYEESLFGVALDGLLVEKTDFNAVNPDGGILFANRGMDGMQNPALSIRGDGKVGIGTSAPQKTLEVAGTIRIVPTETWGNMNWWRAIDLGQGNAIIWRKASSGVARAIGASANGQFYVGRSDGNDNEEVTYDLTVNTLGTVNIHNSFLDMNDNRIIGVATPNLSTDAANKAYVDSLGGRTCANAQILKFQSGSWQCAADNAGGGPDNLGGGGTTTGTLYSKATTGYGYVGQDGNNLLRFDAGAGNDRVLLRVAGTWVLHVEPTFFRPYAHNAIDLGNSGVRWKDGWFSGGVTSGSLSPSGPIYNDHSNATYDVWLQGSNALASGEARNLALLGHTTQDRLYVNYNSEYTGGTTIGGPVSITGVLSGNGSGLTNLNASNLATGTVPIARIGTGTKNTSTFLRGDGTFAAPPSGADNLGNHTATANLNMANRAITADVGTIRDASGGWVRTYNNTGWYNQTYGGGWYMTDSTWIRAYSNKSVVTGGNMQAAAFLYGSDERLKADIKPLNLELDDLENISGYRYYYKSDTDKTPRIGVIAQEVQAVFPEIVKTDEDGMMSVDYPALVPVLLEAVKQLKAENDAIRRQMKADNDNLRMEIRALTKAAR